MDFYHNWFYRQFLNTEWFLWAIVTLILFINILGPAIIWITMRSNKKSGIKNNH